MPRLKDQLHAIWYTCCICTLYEPLIQVLYIGIVYPWTVLALFCQQNLNSLIKGQGKVSLIICLTKYTILIHKHYIYSSIGGCIHQI